MLRRPATLLWSVSLILSACGGPSLPSTDQVLRDVQANLEPDYNVMDPGHGLHLNFNYRDLAVESVAPDRYEKDLAKAVAHYSAYGSGKNGFCFRRGLTYRQREGFWKLQSNDDLGVNLGEGACAPSENKATEVPQ